jgi:hypothetical protein
MMTVVNDKKRDAAAALKKHAMAQRAMCALDNALTLQQPQITNKSRNLF